MERWEALSDDSKKSHKRQNCQACADVEEWKFFTKNSSTGKTNNQELAAGAANIRATWSKKDKSSLEKSVSEVSGILDPMFQKSFGCDMTTAVVTASDVVQRSINVLGETFAEKTLTSALTTNKSMRAVDSFRRHLCLNTPSKEKERHARRDNIKCQRYVFDKDRLSQEIQNTIGKVNWADVARRYDVRRQKDGHLVSEGQASKVLKAYARTAAIVTPNLQSPKLRRTRRRLNVLGQEITVTSLFPTKEKLSKMLRRKVADGEIDIGKSIAPVKFKCTIINSEGKLETIEVTKHSRSLDYQNKLGLLRAPYPEGYSLEKAKEELQSAGMYSVITLQ